MGRETVANLPDHPTLKAFKITAQGNKHIFSL